MGWDLESTSLIYVGILNIGWFCAGDHSCSEFMGEGEGGACHVSEIVFHSTSFHPLALPFLLLPLWQCSLSLGGRRGGLVKMPHSELSTQSQHFDPGCVSALTAAQCKASPLTCFVLGFKFQILCLCLHPPPLSHQHSQWSHFGLVPLSPPTPKSSALVSQLSQGLGIFFSNFPPLWSSSSPQGNPNCTR